MKMSEDELLKRIKNKYRIDRILVRCSKFKKKGIGYIWQPDEVVEKFYEWSLTYTITEMGTPSGVKYVLVLRMEESKDGTTNITADVISAIVNGMSTRLDKWNN